METTHQDIVAYSKELRLPVFRRDYRELAVEAAASGLNYEAYLLTLMQREYELRLENRKKAQIRNAEFPSKMYLSNLNRSQLPAEIGRASCRERV